MPRARPASSSKSTPSNPLKRPLPPNPTDPNTLTPPARQSKRLKSSPLTSSTTKITPKKSQYFSHSSTSEPESEIEAEASGYEDEDASVSAVSSPPVSDDEEDEEDGVSSEEDKKPRRKAKGRIVKKPASNGKSAANGVAANAKAIIEKGKELWRPGVKSDLAPGEEVFIKLPKARSDGGVKYKEGIIHPNTMLFLGDLKENNDREWLKIHDADYRQSKKDFDAFVEKMTEKMTEIDETIPELPPKDLTFRIYRDIRFSSDPTPYKTHFSAAWSRTGRKGPYAGYYLQIKPSGSFIGGGLWCPEAAPLAAMRRDIDRKSHKLRSVLLDPAMRKEFLGGIPKDEKKAVKAFVEQNKENALKTKPKGYDAENPNIALLRLRNYTAGRKLSDDEVVGPKAPERIAALMAALTPFITHLNSVVMPDNPGSNDSESDSEEGDDAEESAEDVQSE
ncbi:MAG: hypothetical protein L6R40_008612 [Gallowayella cf. fulva]|nr:MAG: hypothetical protein L6R40_008612 [Xanthomendoza cf. fulva]